MPVRWGEIIDFHSDVKPVGEIRRGRYDAAAAHALMAWIDSGKKMAIVDTMRFRGQFQGESCFESPAVRWKSRFHRILPVQAEKGRSVGRPSFFPSTTMPTDRESEEPVEVLVRLIRDKAENLYMTRQFYCTESVLLTLNSGLGGGLTDDQAIAVAAPFSIGVGGSGCMCGALAGSILAVGLMVGDRAPYRHRKASRKASGKLHDLFKNRFGGVCCRVLRKKRAVEATDPFTQCARVTAEAAGMTARYLMGLRPDLIRLADREFLQNRDSLAGGTLRRLSRLAGG